MTYLKSTALVIFSLLLVVGIASAALEFNQASVSATGNHNTPVTLNFVLNNSGAALTNLAWALVDNTDGLTLSTAPSATIGANESKTFSAGIGIPAFANGVLEATLRVESGSEEAELPITITVANTPALTISKLQELTANQSGLVNITNTGNVAFTGSSQVILTATGTISVTISPTQLSLPAGTSQTAMVTAVNSDSLNFGSNSVTITARSGSTQAATSFSTIRRTFCSSGERNNDLQVSSLDITSDGDDDEEWKLLDRITIEVDVENNGDDDLDDITVELGLFDSNGENMANELDFDNSEDEEEIDLGDLNDDSEETVTFEFLIPADFDEGSYTLVVKAFSEDLGEDSACSESTDEVSIEKEDNEENFIAFDNIELRPTEASCSDSVVLDLDAYNIGDEDQDRVKITLRNSELELDMSQEIRQGLDEGDKHSLSFSFDVPADARDRTYDLELSAEYDYRNGAYRESLEESTDVPLRVFGCINTTPTPGTGSGSNRIASISATLESAAQAGKEMTVRATIRNLADAPETFLISADGYEDWAELASISDRIVSMDAGDSSEVEFTFLVNDDATGEETFTIEARAGSATETRDVAVEIQDGSAGSGILSGGNTLLWVIGIVNVILIILIIVVAVRIASRD